MPTANHPTNYLLAQRVISLLARYSWNLPDRDKAIEAVNILLERANTAVETARQTAMREEEPTMRDDLASLRERHELEEQTVQVSFKTRADIMEMTDENWITLGKFVAEVAAGVRQRQGEGYR